MDDERSLLNQIRFSQGLSLWRATSRGMGVIVAGIVFVLLGEAVTAAGPLTPLAILLTTLLVVVNILGYVELAVSAPCPGGAYTLVHEGHVRVDVLYSRFGKPAKAWVNSVGTLLLDCRWHGLS